ncbi:hypothetical protein RIF29_00309 [Crotalaria pallida]|uniref:Uncharacterized protein n=1 Tax=Crotalaria pallida TaxID=3830 RepID=A0AAN9P7D3_CROPI
MVSNRATMARKRGQQPPPPSPSPSTPQPSHDSKSHDSPSSKSHEAVTPRDKSHDQNTKGQDDRTTSYNGARDGSHGRTTSHDGVSDGSHGRTNLIGSAGMIHGGGVTQNPHGGGLLEEQESEFALLIQNINSLEDTQVDSVLEKIEQIRDMIKEKKKSHDLGDKQPLIGKDKGQVPSVRPQADEGGE